MSQDFNHELSDDLRDEYDFAQMEGGVRGKYMQDYRKVTNLVLLEPEIMSQLIRR
ncbi:MAG: hypothetical protein QNJ37_11875 [Crocosphaera sp.]|nr:hypothetical protein [Crocosphaera sp.]